VEPHAGLWGIETTAQQLAQEVVRGVPVTVASVALLDQPSRTLTVKAVHAARELPSPVVVGTRVPLSQAPWHRAVFERRQPVCLQESDELNPLSAPELNLSLSPDLRSACLLPIPFGDEIVGVLGLGEMRSPTRAPLTPDKQQRWLALLEEFLSTSAPAWEAARLRRQVRAMSLVTKTLWQMLAARNDEEVLACLGARVSDWLGVPVRGVLVRTRPVNGNAVVTTWQLADTAIDRDHVLLSMARAESRRAEPVHVTRVADDPLDPLHGAVPPGEAWTRIGLPLLDEERLLGVVCLYVQEEIHPAAWELEVFRWLGEATASWFRAMAVLDEERHESDWLRRLAWELSTTHQRLVLAEALEGVARLVETTLPDRLVQAQVSAGPAAGDAGTWRELGELAAREIGGLVVKLRAAAVPAPAAAGTEVQALVRRAVRIARARWEIDARDRGVSLALEVDAGSEPVFVDSGDALLPALAHAIENAVEAVPDGGLIRIHARSENGHALISVADTGPGVAEDLQRRAFEPLVSTKGKPGLGLSVVRSVVARHGGEVMLTAREGGGTVLVLRVPARSESARRG